MSITEQKLNREEGSRRIPLIVAGIIAALLIAGLILYLQTRPTPTPSAGPPQQRLAGALRPGQPEFDQVRDRIAVDEPEAFEANRALGDIVMEFRTTVRNFTGRAINGIEMRAVVVDPDGKTLKERTAIVLPTALANQTELENNKTLPVVISIGGFNKNDMRANFKMELTGITFK